MKRHAVATEPGERLVAIEIVTLLQAQDLAAALLPGIDAQELKDMIDDCGTLYRYGLDAEDAPGPKLIRKELKQLVAALEGALVTLGALDERAKRKLVASLDTMPVLVRPTRFPAGAIFPGTCKLYMRRLKEAAGRACGDLPRGDGRPAQESLRWLCCELASLYERFSSRPFTYNPNFKSGSASEWVAKVVQLIDPEVTPSNLSTALRDLRKPSPK